jgi:hypothetical protein
MDLHTTLRCRPGVGFKGDLPCHYLVVDSIKNKKATPVLFADDTRILCTHHNIVDFHVNSETVLENVNEWLKNNCLALNTEKTHYIHFMTKNSQPLM